MSTFVQLTAEFEAEDALINLLSSLHPRAAAATAAALAVTLMETMDKYLAILPYTCHSGEVYLLTDEELVWRDAARARYQADPQWSAGPNRNAADLIRHLPFDVQVMVSMRAARYLCSREGLKC